MAICKLASICIVYSFTNPFPFRGAGLAYGPALNSSVESNKAIMRTQGGVASESTPLRWTLEGVCKSIERILVHPLLVTSMRWWSSWMLSEVIDLIFLVFEILAFAIYPPNCRGLRRPERNAYARFSVLQLLGKGERSCFSPSRQYRIGAQSRKNVVRYAIWFAGILTS